LTVFIVGASLTVIPLTMVPQQVDAIPSLIPQLTTCSSINDKSNAECQQVKDRTDGSYDNCYTRSATLTLPAANNCKITQTAKASNNFINSETEAKIYQEVNSLVDCDYSANYCLARTFNDATQNVDVKTYRESTTGVKGAIDFDIDQKLTQKIATDNQDRFDSKNTMTQNFFATAIPGTLATSSNTATIDADGSDAHIDQYATQENIECDDSNCINTGVQEYNLQANGRSSIDASHNQGLQLYQTNNGCDDDDTGTVSIDCINDASQVVKLVAGAPNTNNDASITFDTLDNMVVDQYNNCDFGSLDCRNIGQTLVDASATGTSSMKIDNVVQNIDQTSDCDNLNTAIRENSVATTYGCQNKGSVILEADSSTDGVINVPEGEQNLDQLNDCNTASCFNEATLYVGLGSSLLGTDNPVDGTLTADYSQNVDQTNLCNGNAACENELSLAFTAFADGSATVNAESDQTVTQLNECIQGQVCVNSLNMANNVFGSGSATVDSTVSQNMYQSCDSTDGPVCLNTNSMFVTASATGGSDLDYFAIQDFNNNDGALNGQATISYVTDTDPATPAPSSLTSSYQQPQPTTSTPVTVTNPPSNYP
jgi:hypothetical protein